MIYYENSLSQGIVYMGEGEQSQNTWMKSP